LFALFGGLTVDFRDARIDHDIMIDASAVFGGIDLMFPPDVRVVTRATPLFGGVDNKTRAPHAANAPTVTVRCLAAFGGVDIT
jgi:predicted membrane protein